MDDLDGANDERGFLRRLYRQLLPYLGVNHNIKEGWRQLAFAFSRICMRKLLTEVVIARVNLCSAAIQNAFNTRRQH